MATTPLLRHRQIRHLQSKIRRPISTQLGTCTALPFPLESPQKEQMAGQRASNSALLVQTLTVVIVRIMNIGRTISIVMHLWLSKCFLFSSLQVGKESPLSGDMSLGNKIEKSRSLQLSLQQLSVN